MLVWMLTVFLVDGHGPGPQSPMFFNTEDACYAAAVQLQRGPQPLYYGVCQPVERKAN